MKKQRFFTAMATAALLVGTAAAQNSNKEMHHAADTAFATKALQGGMAEVELGQLATQNGSSDKVKQFGQQMVDDHSKAGEELKAIATQKGMSVPSAMDSKAQTMKDKLSNLKGAAFDKAYTKDMVADHKMDVAEFEKEANSGTDPELKAFAAKTLPTLKHHLEMAHAASTAVQEMK